MTNRLINLPDVSSGSNFIVGAGGAELAENRVERSGERALQKNDGAERSAEREVAERERSVERGLQK